MADRTRRGETPAVHTRPRAALRGLMRCVLTVVAAAWMFPVAAVAQPAWDHDDYLVAHEGLIDIYDHDLTYKGTVYNTTFDLNSIAWTPDGWLRTACDTCDNMMDVGPDGPDAFHADAFRRVRLGALTGLVGNIAFGPDGAMFVAMTGNGGSTRAVKKYTIGPDGAPAGGDTADVAADATEVASWSANSLHYAVAVVPDANADNGYVVWAGSEDVVYVLDSNLEFVAPVLDEDVYTTVSMYYDADTNTVLAGRERAPDAVDPEGTLVAVELNAETRTIERRFYLPYEATPAYPHLINGITRGENGQVVAADSGHGRIHIWNADGTYVRSFDMEANVIGGQPWGERAAGSIVWAGNLPPPPPPDTTAPVTTIALDAAAPDGLAGWYVSTVHVTVGATDEVGGSGVAETRCSVLADGATAPTAFTDLAGGCTYAGAGTDLATDGVHTIYAGSQDVAGNTESPLVSATVRLDTTPPVITCQSPAPTFALHSVAGLVTGTAVDALSGPASMGVSAAPDTSTVGPKTVVLSAIDVAGNVGTANCAYEVVDGPPADTAAPVSAIALTAPIPDGANGWYVSPVHVIVSAADEAAGSGVAETRCTVVTGGGTVPASFAALAAGCSYTGAGGDVAVDGIHTVYAGSRDVAGNIESPLVSATLRIDRTPPAITCPASAPVFQQHAVGARVTSQVADTGAGVGSPDVSAAADTSSSGPQTVTLTAVDLAGNTGTAACSYIVEAGDEPPPALTTPEPPAITSVSVAGNLVTVHWRPASTGAAADAYLVEAGDGPGRTTAVAMLSPGLTEAGLLPRGEYFVRVRALNAAGMSAPPADVWTVVTASAPVAGVPVGLQASVAGSTVHLAWQPSPFGDAPQGYRLEVGTDDLSGPTVAQMDLPSEMTSLIVPGVPAGTYVARLRALTAAGPSPPSPAFRIHVGEPAPCTIAPAAPVMLTPLVSGHVVSLWWRSDAHAFHVQAGSAPGASDLAVFDAGTVTGLSASAGDGQYAVRAVADNACGIGPVSVDELVTIGGAVPGAPTGVTATSGPGGITLTWMPPATGPAATAYVVEAGLSPGATLVKVPVGTTPTLTVPGLPSGLHLVARVRAANASGVGAASTEIIVSVP